MRTVIYYSILLIFFAVGCEDSLSTGEDSKITFYTSSDSYSTTDSIKVFIENHTQSNFYISLRCGGYLEMYYQKKEDSTWSKNLWFSWMSLKCVTVIDTIRNNSVYKFTIPSDEINTYGTYRLILANDTSIVSNSFEIK
ncbi:MAG: hypothetical protein WB779_14010 [Ignavibacteriaceae bacterium]|jgi:hypothetical protein